MKKYNEIDGEESYHAHLTNEEFIEEMEEIKNQMIKNSQFIERRNKMEEHEFFCNGKPTMIKNTYEEDSGIFRLTCVNCNKIIYECEFIVEKVLSSKPPKQIIFNNKKGGNRKIIKLLIL